MLTSMVVLLLLSFRPNTTLGQEHLTAHLPPCRNGGTRTYSDGRSFCKCLDSVEAGPLCEITRINFEHISQPLTIKDNIPLSLPLLISMDFVNSDYRGTGQLFALGNEFFGPWIQVAISRGQLEVTASASTSRVSPISLSNNQWHHLDFILAAANGQLELYVIIDKCVQQHRRCSRRLALGAFRPDANATGIFAIGGSTLRGDRLEMMCMERIVVNSELVDLTKATMHRVSLRGCPHCEEACFNSLDGTSKCGIYGACRNSLTLTDDYTCTCQVGYQPTDSPNSGPIYSAPCNTKATEWQSTSNSVVIPLPNKPHLAFKLSVRTRASDFTVLKVGQSGLLSLNVKNGIPIAQMMDTVLVVDAVNVSDGLWHSIHLGLTLRSEEDSFVLLDFSVDELWSDFYKYALISSSVALQMQDISLLIGAESSCVTDVRVEVAAGAHLNKFHQEHLLSGLDSFNMFDLKSGCQADRDPCSTAEGSVCTGNQICLPRWRGHQCICPEGLTLRTTPHGLQCVQTNCAPNPCLNNGQCIPTNSTISWANQSIGLICQCSYGWTGPFCESSEAVRLASVQWWMLPLVSLLIILVLGLILFLCWSYKKRFKASKKLSIKRGAAIPGPSEELGSNGTFKAGEGDYPGVINMSILKVPDQDRNLINSKVPSRRNLRSSEQIRTPDPYTLEPLQPTYNYREDRYHSMDQPLQYAFEGYDTSPPPTYFIPFEFPPKPANNTSLH